MSNYEPNHICKNIYCTKGADGGRKHYYACNFCTRTRAWESVACSFECYQAYVDQVIEARSKGKEISTMPERTDMTEPELQELMETPVEIVKEETAKELSEFADIDGEVNFTEAVEAINKELDKKTNARNAKKQKDSEDVEDEQ
jgi:hypothetical protein